MELQEAIKKIQKEIPATESVQWVAKSDIADSYEVDEEWIGIAHNGDIRWRYASGCSCWDGDYDEDHKPTVKELTLNHKHTPEEWEAAIIRYAETGKEQELS